MLRPRPPASHQRRHPACLISLLVSCLLLPYCLALQDDGALILLSNGPELKLYSRGSSSIPASLRHTTLNPSASRIPVIDYAGSAPDIVTILWLQSPRIVYADLHLSSRTLNQTKAHSLPFNVSHFAVDRYSCNRDLLIVPQEQDKIWRLDAATLELTQLIRDVHNVSRIFAIMGDVYWIEGGRCLRRREILSDDREQHNLTCLSSGDHLAAVYVSHTSTSRGADVFLLSSHGDVYRMREGTSVVKIVAAHEYKDRKVLKYEMIEFDSLYVTSSPDLPDEIHVFVGIKNHGILLKITMHCSGSDSCSIMDIEDEINEHRLYDFKVLEDRGINCSDHTDTIKSQVLLTRKERQDRRSLLSYVSGARLLSFLLGSLFLILALKLLLVFYASRGSGQRISELLGARIQRHDRDAILRKAASINSLSQNTLKFPPKIQASPAPASLFPIPRTVSIEDLTGFENPSFEGGRRNRTLSQKSCGSCDYKDECKDAGMCLSTYRLLHV